MLMKVVFYGSLLEQTKGENSISIKNCPTLRHLLDELENRYGGNIGNLIAEGGTYLLIVNGKGVKAAGGLDTGLNEGDIIEILPTFDAG